MKSSDVAIQMPCGLDWRKMTPREGGRFCGDCKKVVRDLSSMSEDEAKVLLYGPERGSLCVRYVYDAHGKIIFQKGSDLVPAPLLSRAKRTAALLAAAALPLAVGACSAVDQDLRASSSQQQQTADTAPYSDPAGESMGGVAFEPPRPDAEGSDAGADAATEESDAAADPDGGAVIN